MNLLTLRNVQLAFGGPPVLDGINLGLDQGERVCLIGRNGQGKSTLLKLIAGDTLPDNGEMIQNGSLQIAYMPQEVPEWTGRVRQIASEGLGELASDLQQYQVLSEACADGDTDACTRMLDVQHRIDARQGWEAERKVDRVLERMQLDPDADIAALSGGQKRRVLLARALLSEPDILLLDEPTNHLDMENIEWLEQMLLGWPNLTLFFISHDRAFVDRLATRIVELDRGQLRSYPGNYARYQELKQQELEAEEQQNARFDKKLAQEEVWIRQGIKARRTRNEGRVRALKALRDEHRQRRQVEGRVNFGGARQDLQQSGRVVFDINNLQLAAGGRTLVEQFTQLVMRGDKIALIGPNGAGKTTLVRALLGEYPLQQGSVRQGTQLEVAYFDQLRNQLQPEDSVLDNVAPGSDFVEVNGQRRHILSYLQDFLFSPERARTPVRALSGGERNRLLLARLMLKPANLLVLDEPTNDLDMDTLELLEEMLGEYAGTLLLISHDRAFIDRIASSTWVFEGDGRLNAYVGGYEDYLHQKQFNPPADKKRPGVTQGSENRDKMADGTGQGGARSGNSPAASAAPAEKKRTKLSYNEQRELDTLPEKIATLEQEQAELSLQLADGTLYSTDSGKAQKAAIRLAEIEETLLELLERWTLLESKTQGE